MFLFNRSTLIRQVIALPKTVCFLNNEIREIHTRNNTRPQISNQKKTSTVQRRNEHFDWDKMRYFFLIKKKCDKNDVNSIILDFCKTSKNPIENALSYTDYLKKNNLSLCNKNIHSHVLKLFISHAFNGVKLQAGADDSRILKLYVVV